MMHMKKFASVVLAASVFLSFTPLVSAEGKFQTARQEVKERSATKEAQRKSTITKFFNNMVERLQVAEDRLNKILERIESRVAKIKSGNPSRDLTKVDADIAAVKTLLANTQTKIDALKASPVESLKTVKEDASGIKKDLQTAKRLLSQIIGQIQGLRVGETKK